MNLINQNGEGITNHKIGDSVQTAQQPKTTTTATNNNNTIIVLHISS
jgi:hypothetical protein